VGGTRRRDSRKTRGDSVGIPAINGEEDIKAKGPATQHSSMTFLSLGGD